MKNKTTGPGVELCKDCFHPKSKHVDGKCPSEESYWMRHFREEYPLPEERS